MSIENAYIALAGAFDGDVQLNVPLRGRTSLKIGGPCALMVRVNSFPDLKQTVKILEAQAVPWVVLGGGSKVLVSDQGYQGCIIMLEGEFQRCNVIEPADAHGEYAQLIVGAGCLTRTAVMTMLHKGLSGAEFLAGIPGTMGGALATNAGTATKSIQSVVESLIIMDSTGTLQRLSAEQCAFGYRSLELPSQSIILEAQLKLYCLTKEQVGDAMDAYIKRSKLPRGVAHAGTMFLNPREAGAHTTAALLLEQCGVKNLQVGGAWVSREHANVIVNKQLGAQASDVLALMQEMHKRVRETYNINLQPEIKLLGFDQA